MEKSKKLIYILNHYSDKTTQHFYHIINLLNVMASKGIQIALVIEKSDGVPENLHSNIIVICQREISGIKRVKELFNILIGLIDQGYKKTFIRISKNSTIIAIIANKIKNGEVYYWNSGTTFDVDKSKPFKQRVKWLITSYSLFCFIKRFTNYFVTGPESMIEYYVDEVKVKKEKMLLLYNDIDIERFGSSGKIEKLNMREKLKINKDTCILLMVHRLSPIRRTNLYIPEILDIDALKGKNVQLLIIGEGPEQKLLEESINSRKMNNMVKFLGAKPNSEITDYYKASDIFINPSYTEGFPRVVIEAMASGLPIVATDAGGTKDLVGENQKKYIIDKENIELFKCKLIELIEDENIRKELAAENSKQVFKYSTEEVAKQYIERIFS